MFGAAPYFVESEQYALLWVLSCTCISSPITVSYLLKSIDIYHNNLVTNIQKVIRHFSRGNVTEFFNLKFIQQKNEIFHFECSFPEAARNAINCVQGGFIGAALDEATSFTVLMYNGATKAPNSTDIHMTFHRPMSVGPAKIETKILKAGKRIVSIEGKIFLANNKLAASALHTGLLLDLPPL